ncbi:MAG: response regulator transcription factor [Proteobacteria bacterium]|nr:response regulator transcription factor [Pseudomonadota bacterium]
MEATERILIVDDQLEIQKYLSEILSDNYDLEIASSGEEALQKVGRFRPDVILLDVKLKGMNGLEVCKTLRSRKDIRDVKIIFLSGHTSLDHKMEGYRVGGDDYITKPFDEEELLAKLKVFTNLEHKSSNEKKILSDLEDKSIGICYEIKRKLRYITHIKADSPYCNVYDTKDKGDFFRVRIPIKKLEDFFKGTNLIRVHRSYLVNTKYISNISTMPNHNSYEGQITVRGDENKPVVIPIGKSYQASISS